VLQAGARLDNRYLLKQRLGAGGMARCGRGPPCHSRTLADGEKNRALTGDQFLTGIRAMLTAVRAIRTFAILFGEAKPDEPVLITEETHGALLDANT
jgi:hypothetical protein